MMHYFALYYDGIVGLLWMNRFQHCVGGGGGGVGQKDYVWVKVQCAPRSNQNGGPQRCLWENFTIL